MRFYGNWIQDGGYGAACWCHEIFEAPDLDTAFKEGLSLIRKQKQVCAISAYDEVLDVVVPIPTNLNYLTDAEIKSLWKEKDFPENNPYSRNGKGPFKTIQSFYKRWYNWFFKK